MWPCNRLRTMAMRNVFKLSNQSIVKVGVVFDGEKGCIGEWKVAR